MDLKDIVIAKAMFGGSGGGGGSDENCLLSLSENTWQVADKSYTGTMSSGIKLATTQNVMFLPLGDAHLTVDDTEYTLNVDGYGLWTDEESNFSVEVDVSTSDLIVYNPRFSTSTTYSIKLVFDVDVLIASDDFVEMLRDTSFSFLTYHKNTYVTFRATWGGIGTVGVKINGVMYTVPMMGNAETIYGGTTDIAGEMFSITQYRFLIPVQAIGSEISITWTNYGATARATVANIEDGVISNNNTLTFTPTLNMHGNVNVEFMES